MSASAVENRPGSSEAALRELARTRFRMSAELPSAFFEANAGHIARACLDLARAFHGRHRLLVFGTGAQASDALHVSVEFVHPVIVGKRALPVLALTDDPAGWLRALGEPGDMALALDAGTGKAEREGTAAREGLAAARAAGMGTVALVGPEADGWDADHVFAVPSEDPFAIQEVHETVYHVFWELVHVFLDHPEVLR